MMPEQVYVVHYWQGQRGQKSILICTTLQVADAQAATYRQIGYHTKIQAHRLIK
jgi:hypothetical protein